MTERTVIKELRAYFALEYKWVLRDIELNLYPKKEIVNNAKQRMVGAVGFSQCLGVLSNDISSAYNYWSAELDKLLD